MRKTRSDSILGNLPPPTKDAIYQLCNVPGKSIADSCKELSIPKKRGGFGIRISTGALSGWLAGYRTEKYLNRLRMGRERIDAAETQLKGDYGRKYDPVFFEGLREFTLDLLASDKPDQRAIHRFGSLILKERQISLEHERFKNTIKSDIEKGLDALHSEISDNCEALQVFERLKAVVMNSMGGAT